MEQNLNSPEVYDFRKYDRIWQRVAPGLEPYPASQQSSSASNHSQMPASSSTVSSSDPALTQSAQQKTHIQPNMARQESLLPGADPNPCCMGTAAAELLEVLSGFIEEELEDQRQLLALARYASSVRQASFFRQRLRDMAAEEGAHARRLMTAYYLITGECYRPSISCGRIHIDHWCSALRERYHAAACNGLNYQRTAESTTDLCLIRLLNELSADEYRHADILMCILERSLRE